MAALVVAYKAYANWRLQDEARRQAVAAEETLELAQRLTSKLIGARIAIPYHLSSLEDYLQNGAIRRYADTMRNLLEGTLPLLSQLEVKHLLASNYFPEICQSTDAIIRRTHKLHIASNLLPVILNHVENSHLPKEVLIDHLRELGMWFLP